MLEDVVRQKVESNFVQCDTYWELLLKDQFQGFKFRLDGFKDVKQIIEGNEFLELLSNSLDRDGIDQTVLIVHSNKGADL